MSNLHVDKIESDIGDIAKLFSETNLATYIITKVDGTIVAISDSQVVDSGSDLGSIMNTVITHADEGSEIFIKPLGVKDYYEVRTPIEITKPLAIRGFKRHGTRLKLDENFDAGYMFHGNYNEGDGYDHCWQLNNIRMEGIDKNNDGIYSEKIPSEAGIRFWEVYQEHIGGYGIRKVTGERRVGSTEKDRQVRCKCSGDIEVWGGWIWGGLGAIKAPESVTRIVKSHLSIFGSGQKAVEVARIQMVGGHITYAGSHTDPIGVYVHDSPNFLLGVDIDLDCDASGTSKIIDGSSATLVNDTVFLGSTREGLYEWDKTMGQVSFNKLSFLGEEATLYVDSDQNLVIESLPTRDPGIKNALWNDNGALRISSG